MAVKSDNTILKHTSCNREPATEAQENISELCEKYSLSQNLSYSNKRDKGINAIHSNYLLRFFLLKFWNDIWALLTLYLQS